MDRWGFYRDQRSTTLGFAKMMWAGALVAAIAEFWAPVRVPLAALLAIYGMWCFNASQWMQLHADQQARIDMLKLANGKEPD